MDLSVSANNFLPSLHSSGSVIISKQLEVPKVSNFLHFKLLKGFDHNENIDIKFIGATGVPLPGLEALLAADEATPGNHDEAMNNKFHANMKHCIVQWKVNV